MKLPPELSDAARRLAPERVTEFEDFFSRVLALVAVAVASMFEEYQDILRESTEAFLVDSTEELARWSGLLAAGAITPRDYSALVRARSAIARMEALSLAGMTRGEVSRFRSLLVESVVAAAIKVFLGRK